MTQKQNERKKTDIERVREEAKYLLEYGIIRTAQSPHAIHHPFAGHGLFILPGDPPFTMTDITASPKNFKRWKDWMRSRFDKADSAYEIGLMVHHPYRFTFVAYTQEYISDEEFAKLLHFAWFGSRGVSDEEEVEPRDLVEMFRRAKAEYLMSMMERSILTQLPDEVIIYRGVNSNNAFYSDGMSWTLKEESAARFASLGGYSGDIYQAKIRKKDILALFLKEEEFEVVVDPERLHEITRYHSISQQPEDTEAEDETTETITENDSAEVMRYDF